MAETIVPLRDVDGRDAGGNPVPQPMAAVRHGHPRIWLAVACCLLAVAAGGA